MTIFQQLFRPRPRRSQAALFDGIMFLLFTSASMVMVFAFLGSYGTAEDQTLRSAYQLAYIDSVGKALYQIHAQTLTDAISIPPLAVPCTTASPPSPAGCALSPKDETDSDYCATHSCSGPQSGKPYADLAPVGPRNPAFHFTCAGLADFPGQTVADLLKKDLADSNDEASVCLDNHFGNRGETCTSGTAPSSLPVVPGKVALRCALEELMKPFDSSGQRYFADIVTEAGASSGNTVPQEAPDPSDPTHKNPAGWQRITNSYVADAKPYSSCQDVADHYLTDVLPGSTSTVKLDLLTESLPFRIPHSDTIQAFFAESLRVCVWKTQVGSPR